MSFFRVINVILWVMALVVPMGEAQETPGHVFPVPETVSPELRALIAAAPPPFWNYHPADAAAWKAWAAQFAEAAAKDLPQLRKKMGVTMTTGQLGGVPVFVLTPEKVAAGNEDRVLLYFHGGGYVLNAGEAGTQEAVLMAGFGGFRVVSVDYRVAPDAPYPAAIDDAVAVYRELLQTTPPESIGVFGTSTGGAMTLILALRAKAEGLPLPGALAAGTPWTDLGKVGDSYFTHEGLDNVIHGYDGWVGQAAKVYANGHDLKDPMLSPVYGDVAGFPPTLLTSGTRDLFLSNTVRMHLKLREAGAEADLVVFEGMSHAQYHMAEDAPETGFHFRQLKQFFERHLRRVAVGESKDMTSVRIAKLKIKPEHLEVFTAAVREEMREALRVEPGVLALYAVADKDDPTKLTFFEMYVNEDAYQLHRKTPHFIKYYETTKDMIAERTLAEATPVELRDKWAPIPLPTPGRP